MMHLMKIGIMHDRLIEEIVGPKEIQFMWKQTIGG
jgi:hypothetical protein